MMEKEIRVFKSFAEADAADDRYYASLKPAQRLAMTFEIVAKAHPHEIKQRSERICRVIKLKGS
jgi:hypothetical protein